MAAGAPHRSDLEAAHARIAALERELAAARTRGRTPLRCGSCKAGIEPGNVDPTTSRVVCGSCGLVIAVAERPRGGRKKPAGVVTVDRPGLLRIEIRWGGAGAAVFVSAFFLTLTLLALAVKSNLLAALGGVTALGSVYLAFARALNTCAIEVTASTLSIRHEPVPTRLPIEVPAAQIAQLYCEIVAERYGDSYKLCALWRGGHRQELLDKLADPEAALYLEERIEMHLGVTDEPVTGELPRH